MINKGIARYIIPATNNPISISGNAITKRTNLAIPHATLIANIPVLAHKYMIPIANSNVIISITSLMNTSYLL